MFTVTDITEKKLTKIVWNTADFPYEKFKELEVIKGKNKNYINAICTFDIETTSLRENQCTIFGKPFAFMYVWQFCIEGEVVVGRTWKSFREFIEKLLKTITRKGFLVIYVHNLAFEFQFFRNFFEIDSVFARKPRNPIKVVSGYLEFRCSLALSNMGLEKWLQNGKHVTFQKMSGHDFDYSIIRYPDTELTKEEWGYCICDVMGLYERLKEVMEEDTLATVPMTSTGYVRRDYRNAMSRNPENRKLLIQTRLSEESYYACFEAVRGGISGSNAVYTDYVVDNVDSFDIKSSYPYQMLTKYFPVSRFVKYRPKDYDHINKLLKEYCCLIFWEGENVRLKKWSSIPFIAKDKCRAIYQGKYGNGKVYKAKRIGMICTEIDFALIQSHYIIENIKIHYIWASERGMLPKEYREHLAFMFQEKTNLEDGDPYLYAKYKNRINGSFGMMLTNILNDEIVYDSKSDDVWKEVKLKSYSDALEHYYKNKNSFLAYQWGVWVTAHARRSLMEGIDTVGNDIVQTDTDSVKCVNNHREDFEKINTRIIKEAEDFDIKPYAIKNGNKHYLGVWEYEKHYDEFKTLGAKKYAYSMEGKISVTVAGLRPKGNKKDGTKGGAEFVEENGGLDKCFNAGQVFPHEYSGRTETHYCDLQKPQLIFIKGHEIVVGSSVAIFPSEYTLGITSEWNEIITGNYEDIVLSDFSVEI